MVKYLVLKADITKVCLEKFEYVIGCLYDFVNRIAQKKLEYTVGSTYIAYKVMYL